MKHHYLIMYIAISSLIMLAGCTTSSSENLTVEPPTVEPPVVEPPVPSSLALTDITLDASGGETSRYSAATVTIEGNLIVIANITNHFDTTRTETLRISIADTDSPVAYTIEPEFVTITANELNPDGTAAVTNIPADHTFTLTPANGDTAIIYAVSLRLSELEVVMLTPLSVEDIEINTASHSVYANASVLSVSDNIVSIGGIKNRTNGFNQNLTLTIADKTNPPEYTVAGGSTVTLAGTEINPPGITNITTPTNEALTFMVTPTANNASPVKYYVVLVLGDLIQLELLGGADGDLMTALTLTEGITPATDTITVKNCGVFPPPYRVFVGGTPDTTTAYTLTATGINPYVSPPQTSTGDLRLSDGITTLTFSSLSVMTSSCAAADLSGMGTSSDPYIIDSDRKLNLVAGLVNGNVAYRGRHYRVTRDIDLARPMAPWSEAQNGQFTPIGAADSTVFNGTFDCQGNVISNLYINTTGSYKGLFGVVGTGMITNCGLVNANVTVDGTSELYVGSLVGLLNIGGTVTKSYSKQATVTITGADTTVNTVLGGLVGYNLGTISDSYSTGTVNNSGSTTGGLAGQNAGGMISQSYSSANVSGHTNVGGLVGDATGNTMIENSYATGNITANNQAGGLVGAISRGSIVKSYATGEVSGTSTSVNGLIGSILISANVTITASYWDTVTSGRTSWNGAAIGRTTTQMQVGAPSADVYTGWETGIWDFRANAYPRLKSVACATRQYAPATTRTCEDIP
ncbi:hypothetical protein COTS27_01414 [Spirochaetota bacterium]|nr:hypothetical protein COTS27_01414 [Spirochaetota bacterium]